MNDWETKNKKRKKARERKQNNKSKIKRAKQNNRGELTAAEDTENKRIKWGKIWTKVNETPRKGK